ncbi:TRAPPII-specific subunit TRS120 [Cyberlindnera jadinii NRRL Y-1542]|uniref:Trs120-domain-containing protein n=1 Tax=Cyberlindnera jadinii (strain ATCC 18201 / CBS 1600 / BCRC 20928 / JCM 3617 / NBRC 0987 / NRRL Y-1542) TaxID=983966 RepID=A0A1E4RZG6_CYBJN|nr:Trs120-domain-containing protein [Cyberlindnera jadinii NRRL Y-1542]ODV72640.1 Trs120-domain-containing protein [Cyberlindnera jadinii NRRL Y-1542]
MDTVSFVSPARVRTLLVPIGSLEREQFQRYVRDIEVSSEVRLVDVTRTRTRTFNPQGFPDGRVLYDFTTSLDSQETLFLQDFEPYRKTFVVIGLASSLEEPQEALESLKRLYKSSVVHCIVVFDKKPEFEHESVIFNATNTETVICDITRLFLDGLTGYLVSFQHITLRSPGTLGGNERAKTPVVKSKRISSGSSIGFSLSSDPANSKISIKSSNERRQARIKGRQQKILGNLLLIAGKYSDALKEFQEALILLKSGYDYLWIASTLEGIAVSIVMLCYLDLPYQLGPALNSALHSSAQPLHTLSSPSSTPNSSPRSSMAIGSLDLERFTTTELIYQILCKMIYYFESSQSDPEDYVPDLVYCESILRFLKLMTVVNFAGGLNTLCLHHMIKGRPLSIHSDIPYTYDKMDMVRISNKVMSVQFKSMDILSQTRIFGSLSALYGDMGLPRKRNFMLRTLFVCLIPQLKAQPGSSTDYDLTDIFNVLMSVYGVDRQSEANIESAHAPRWIQIVKSTLKLCSAISAELSDVESVIKFKSLMLTRFADSLTDNEQAKLLADIERLSKEHDIQVYYPDPFVLRSINLVKLSNPPMKQKTAVKENSTDPVLYNPYLQTAIIDKSYVVQGEFTEFLVEIQNPFAFAISINEIKIPGLEIFKNHFTIQPKTIGKINVLTKPLTPGKLVIDSAEIRISEFSIQRFKICKAEKAANPPKLKHQETTNKDILNTFYKNMVSNNVDGRAETSQIELHVITAQPNLQLTSHIEPLMLLEGGKQIVEVKLKNHSDISVNILKFSIWDSTINPLSKLLESRDKLATDLYEYEYFLYKRSVNIISKIDEIQPNEEVPLLLEVVGKRGAVKVKLALEYGHSDDSGLQFTRCLDIPVPITVQQSTDLADCDVIPLSESIGSSEVPIWQYVNEKGGAVSDYVLFFVDIRNVSNKPINIDVQYKDYKVSDNIVPMDTKRLTIPMKRIDIDYENLKPIPLKHSRFTRSRISKNEEQFQKESFWYREELLRDLKGTWSIGEITGDIEFRGIRLTQKMLTVMRVEKVNVSIDIEGEVARTGRFRHLTPGEFFTVNVTIENKTERALKGTLRNIPTTSTYGSIEKKILYNGILQMPLDEDIAPGTSVTHSMGAVLLESGEYEWGAVFDELGNELQHVSRIPLYIKAT